MAKTLLRYKITPSAPGRKKGVFCIVVFYEGNAKDRKIFPISGLVNPDIKFWDPSTQRFVDGTFSAQDNNPILDALCARCDEILKGQTVLSPEDFISHLKGEAQLSVEPTFGEFLCLVIEEMRTGTNNKRPSRNYQNYRNLYHKLEREGYIINLPVKDVANAHFIRFSNFILSLGDGEGRSNYMNLMKLFKQIHKKAFDRELTDNLLRFRYGDAAPALNDTEKSSALTKKQYESFCSLDLSQISHSGPSQAFYKELYHDFCIFLYESKMRPVDVIRARVDGVVSINSKKYIKYVAEKKKNYRGRNKIVTAPLSERALAIIRKYKDQSKYGYIFPFAMNNFDWDFDDAVSWNNWNNRKARALEMINQWLKKVQPIIGVKFPITLYTFRHSALTHACLQKGANYLQIALEAGTSPDMLLKHYVSNTDV